MVLPTSLFSRLFLLKFSFCSLAEIGGGRTVVYHAYFCSVVTSSYLYNMEKTNHASCTSLKTGQAPIVDNLKTYSITRQFPYLGTKPPAAGVHVVTQDESLKDSHAMVCIQQVLIASLHSNSVLPYDHHIQKTVFLWECSKHCSYCL